MTLLGRGHILLLSPELLKSKTIALSFVWKCLPLARIESLPYGRIPSEILSSASSLTWITIKSGFVIMSADMDQSPGESLCIQFDIQCISLLWRRRGRSSSLCWRYTAGSLSRSRCNHTPTYAHTKTEIIICCWSLKIHFIQTLAHQADFCHQITCKANVCLGSLMRTNSQVSKTQKFYLTSKDEFARLKVKDHNRVLN